MKDLAKVAAAAAASLTVVYLIFCLFAAALPNHGPYFNP